MSSIIAVVDEEDETQIQGTNAITDIVSSTGSIQQPTLHNTLCTLENHLQSHGLLDEQTALLVWNWILECVSPVVYYAEASQQHQRQSWSASGRIAVGLLIDLSENRETLLNNVTSLHLATLIFWTSSSESWIIAETRTFAAKLLDEMIKSRSLTGDTSSTSITTTVLEEIVRPAFIRARPGNITEQGRQAVNPQAQAFTASEDEPQLKPWKYGQKYVVDILSWVLEQSEGKTIEDNWYLITPPVLTLADDGDTDSKIRGCELLQILLAKVSATSWTRTGLGKVFEQALIPLLAYLPPLVEQKESKKILTVVYPTLLSLYECQYPSSTNRQKKLAMLDELLRTGVLTGLSHSGENIMIACLLLEQMGILLGQMEIHSVKHLKVCHILEVNTADK